MDRLGQLNFIEVNPLAGLNPVHSDLPIICRLLNISYLDLIERILASTIKRIS
jgi:D-alanine-D-alanine ligase